MKYYYYKFTDGYYCYVSGKMNSLELKHEIAKHGDVVESRKVKV